ncbi:hypothetical protein [Pectobacterium parmentieri]|uniref:hypothetical protein n=1 Tax=Pectobacterium parmentieri TaxID=1905730 RepID=UPI0013C436B9
MSGLQQPKTFPQEMRLFLRPAFTPDNHFTGASAQRIIAIAGNELTLWPCRQRLTSKAAGWKRRDL